MKEQSKIQAKIHKNGDDKCKNGQGKLLKINIGISQEGVKI
jgi:hypothetical protein